MDSFFFTRVRAAAEIFASSQRGTQKILAPIPKMMRVTILLLAVEAIYAPPTCADYHHFELAPIVAVEGGVYLIGGSNAQQGVGSGSYHFQRIPTTHPLDIREANGGCTVELVHCTQPVDAHCAGGGIWTIHDDCAGFTLSMFSLYGGNMGVDRFLYEASCSTAPPPPPSPFPSSPPAPAPPPLPPDCSLASNAVYVVDRSSSLEPIASDVRVLLHQQVAFFDYAVSMVGLVGFGNTAAVVAPLSQDEEALHAIIDQEFSDASFNDITHINAGLLAAQDMLSETADGIARVVVLLTDGRQNEAFGGDATAIATASQLTTAGIRLFVVGLVDPLMPVVEVMASEPTNVHAIDGEVLGIQATSEHLFVHLCSTEATANASSFQCAHMERQWSANVCCDHLTSACEKLSASYDTVRCCAEK